MRYLKKGVKVVLKVLLLLIVVPIILNAGFLFVQSCMRASSIDFCGDMIQSEANSFMAEYGNRYFAYDLVYYMSKQRDPDFCDDAFHQDTFAKMLKKYPDKKEAYLAAFVEAILDSDTRNYNRIQMIGLLERITGIDFRERHGELIDYDDMKPYTQKAIRNIADWWSKHLEENATAAIAATETDYKFPPVSPEYLEIMGITPEEAQ